MPAMPRETELYITDGFPVAWEVALRPWFVRACQSAWRSHRPTVVLVPSRSYGFFLKFQLLESSKGFAGISFWTPGECRSFLQSRFCEALPVASREDLQLLLATVAERAAESPVARAVARDPASVLRCVEQVTAAGWDMQELGGANLEPLLEKFAKTLKKSGLQTAQQADRWLWERCAKQAEPIFESLLVVGFTGTHWPIWDLLGAAVSVAKSATVGLFAPGVDAQQIDKAWIDSWERHCGRSPSAYRRRAPNRTAHAKLDYRIGQNLREQAHAIVAQAVAYLADKSCARLGILFPSYGALSREVASLLGALEIPHNDAIGHFEPAPSDGGTWHAWLALQRHGRLEPFKELLHSCPAAVAHLPGNLKDVERALDDAFTEVLVDDLAVIAAFLRQRQDETRRKIGEAIVASFARLPEKATLTDFVAKAASSLSATGMSDRAMLVAEHATTLARCEELIISRDAFLRWLDESQNVRKPIRDESGSHPYARVQLLLYRHAENQTWSHLILAGLNDGEWPPPFESSGFLPEPAIEKLNKRTTAEDKVLCLGPSELRALAHRTFARLVESTEVATCATASLTSETEPDRHLVASESLMKLFFEDRGETLGNQQLAELQQQTSAWLEKSRLFETTATGDKSVAQTGRAFAARRDETKKFAEYEFALARPPQRPLSLPCKEWENALQDPGSVFLKRILGVEASRAGTDEDRWSLTAGTWIHRWLRSAADPAGNRGFVKIPSPVEFSRELRAATVATQRAAAEAFDDAGRAMPRWWLAGWAEAVWKAEQFAAALAALPDWPWLAAEWSLPDGVTAKLPDGAALRLRGRIDLLLAQQPRADAGTLWVLDFKTGRMKVKLTGKNLAKGTGVQVALYALALQSLGAADVTASLVRLGEPVEAGLKHDEVVGATAVWETLCAMQDTGVFGMIGELRPEFGLPRTYPLATLPINLDVLEKKWALTHPKLQPEEDEE
jgi:hypothetical protein